MGGSPQQRVYRFEGFAFDPLAGELRRQGRKLKIQGQPVEILTMLLERPGEIVTREELQKKLWPENTFVDFEHSLNAAIKRLRDAMGDSAEAPRYVETLARRGYRFIGVVELPGEPQEAQTKPPEPAIALGAVPAAGKSVEPLSIRRRLFVAGSVLIAGLIAGGLYLRLRQTARITEKDTIVIADFVNTTGDPVFDNTLKQGLAVDLGQSPFLNILSDSKVTAMLHLMGRTPGQPVTGEVARELCQRVGSKAMLAGSISNLGTTYVIGLNAINCATGDALVRQQIEARAKEEVLKTLGNAATEMRSKLGESLASVQKFATPLEEATTSSLEALKAYTEARRALATQGEVASLPYYQRAVELDPNFALAYRSMAVAYSNLGQAARASENATRAFELRQRVSEREGYAIEANYYIFVTGDLQKTNHIHELWKQSYPRDYLAPGELADNYMRLGEWEKALRETQESNRLEPNFAVGESNFAWEELALNRADEARTTVQEALAHKLDSPYLRLALYETAFLRGDQTTMEQQLAWAAGRAGEEDGLSAQSDTEAYFGRMAKAQQFSQRAVESARRADANEAAGLWRANAALREAEFGKASSARQSSIAALALMSSKNVKCVAALALARAAETAQAQKLADDLNKDFPQDTIVQGYWLPAIRAAIQLNAKNGANAVEILEAAKSYELGQNEPIQLGMLYPIYLRGQAYLLERRDRDAAVEFQKIVDHRGIVLNCPIGALAHLGLARAYALQGDAAKARAAYQDFLTLWKDADTDIPVFQQARAESAKLQ